MFEAVGKQMNSRISYTKVNVYKTKAIGHHYIIDFPLLYAAFINKFWPEAACWEVVGK